MSSWVSLPHCHTPSAQCPNTLLRHVGEPVEWQVLRNKGELPRSLQPHNGWTFPGYGSCPLCTDSHETSVNGCCYPLHHSVCSRLLSLRGLCSAPHAAKGSPNICAVTQLVDAVNMQSLLQITRNNPGIRKKSGHLV